MNCPKCGIGLGYVPCLGCETMVDVDDIADAAAERERERWTVLIEWWKSRGAMTGHLDGLELCRLLLAAFPKPDDELTK